MYRSRKATAVFQHTNPLKEERFMKEWQVSKWSPLTKVYTQYSTWRKTTSTPVLGVCIPPFTLQLLRGRRGRGGSTSFRRCRHLVGSVAPRGTPRKPPYSLRVVTPDDCTGTLLAWMQLSIALNSVKQATVNGLTQLLELVAGDERYSTEEHWYITTLRTSACTRQRD